MTDIEIAESVKPNKIRNIDKKLGLKPSEIVQFGDYKAKITKKIKPSLSIT